MAKTPEVFAHDLDGNLTEDACWKYTWDGENRLVAVETNPSAVAVGVTKQKLEFAYDGQSRRISKKVHAWNGTSFQLSTHTLFLYDGWNLPAELNALNSNAAIRTYVWGLDLSGSMQGAGGVGGVLAVTDAEGATTHFSAFDGNGNVGGLINAASGLYTAKYDNNAFGEAVSIEGGFAAANPFRFSTKYIDIETGHLYYGYRCYAPEAGRWLSRDPIEEQGGANLYSFLGNNSISDVDPFGLEDAEVDYVAKSFINRIPNLGSLKGRIGFDPATGVSLGLFANTRLRIFAEGVRRLPAFNENPSTDAKDGQYRLYTRVTIKASCCADGAPKVTISTDQDGGREGPGVSGTINLSGPDVTTVGSTTKVHWKGWGRPADIAEPGMQWVAIRTSRNIWHDVTIVVSCKGGKPSFQEDALSVSKFPSFRLWQDGKPIDERRQGALSDLWQADPSNPSFVAP